MSEVIDVLVEMDLASMPQLSKDKAQPTQGLNNLIFLRVKDANGVTGQGGAELRIKGSVGDNVRWRSTSLSGNFEKSVVLYDFRSQSSQGGDLSTPELHGGVKNGNTLTTRIMTPIQGPLPLSSELVATPYNYVESTLEAHGTITYQFLFQVNDSGSGDLIGYGTWDPFIDIEN
ncbi:hypothetical protein JK628_19380 [Shewanella sp. KX20019]|uniref:AidA/PixA family protein n=1 Tax=Shewanella sp. KX20019 TaxID=2803864 RepID=UPI0019257BEC|nr:AidA/PixA family protein [Shewanella sp. KX20019]QQX79653.1 hypothetical protein JK628_19380 [Shewanella sp. KX20019]